MKKKELIKVLEDMDDNAVIQVFDSSSGAYQPVSCVVHEYGKDGKGEVFLMAGEP
jgi:peptide subunit release factor RF-3